MKKIVMLVGILACTVALAGPAAASTGMMGGSSMGPQGLIVADDGSVLLREGVAPADGTESFSASVVNITAAGIERWSVSFDEGWPMMISTAGDVVVVTLTDGAWMGGGMGGGANGGGHMGGDSGGMGSGSGSGNGSGGGMGGGHGMGITVQDEPTNGAGATLVALDLATGIELWRFTPDTASMISADVAPGGATVYAIVHTSDAMDSTPMNQGEADQAAQGTASLVALDAATGTVLFTREIATAGMGGMF